MDTNQRTFHRLLSLINKTAILNCEALNCEAIFMDWYSPAGGAPSVIRSRELAEAAVVALASDQACGSAQRVSMLCSSISQERRCLRGR